MLFESLLLNMTPETSRKEGGSLIWGHATWCLSWKSLCSCLFEYFKLWICVAVVGSTQECRACGGPRRPLDGLAGIIVYWTAFCDAGNWTCALCKSSTYRQSLSHLSSSQWLSLLSFLYSLTLVTMTQNIGFNNPYQLGGNITKHDTASEWEVWVFMEQVLEPWKHWNLFENKGKSYRTQHRMERILFME